jgi:hypothetical protein
LALLFGGLDQGHGPLVAGHCVAEIDARGLFGHFAQPQDDAEPEAIAHRRPSPRRADNSAPALGC